MNRHHAIPASLLSRLRRHALWLPLLGLIVLGLQILAGMVAPTPARATGTESLFVAELCTAHGITSAPAAAPDNTDGSSFHDCCKLCAASAPLLFSAAPATVVSASTFTHVAARGIAAHTPRLSRNSHPPRAPPLV
jgi:hypothetical protein